MAVNSAGRRDRKSGLYPTPADLIPEELEVHERNFQQRRERPAGADPSADVLTAALGSEVRSNLDLVFDWNCWRFGTGEASQQQELAGFSRSLPTGGSIT